MKNSEVKDSRPSDKYGGSIRRRRINTETGVKFTTYELSADQIEQLASTFSVKIFNELVGGLGNTIAKEIGNQRTMELMSDKCNGRR